MTEIQNATRLPEDAGPVTESYEATEEQEKLYNLAQTLFEGSFGEIFSFLTRTISEKKIMRILIDQLIRFEKEQPEVFAWLSQTEKRTPIGLFKFPQYSDDYDKIMDTIGHSVYWLEIFIPHANKLVTNLGMNIIGQRNMCDFFFGNGLHVLKYDEDGITFGYVGQTAATSPRVRLGQHEGGHSGARLIEAIIKSYPEPDEIKFRFCVISSQDPISDLAREIELEPKVVTSVTEIIDINILRTANKYSCMGLNVDYGKSFGGAGFDARAAGRGNLQKFSPRMCEDLKTLFPVTGHLCQAENCENALRLERDDIYAYCQSCAGLVNQTYIVARVKEVNGESTVVEAEDQMPKRDALRIRDYFRDLSWGAYLQNKKTREKPFAEGSLIKPIEDIVKCEGEGWKCKHPDCKNKDKDKRRKIYLWGHQWYISDWCQDHRGTRKWRRFRLNVNTCEWKEVLTKAKHLGRPGQKRERSDSEMSSD